MPPEEQDFDKECLVCGKGVAHEEGFCRLKVGEHFIALCCPLCMEVYQKNPQRYLARLSIRNLRPPGVRDGDFRPMKTSFSQTDRSDRVALGPYRSGRLVADAFFRNGLYHTGPGGDG